eukprot:3378677-Rhodomonas_salina.2
MTEGGGEEGRECRGTEGRETERRHTGSRVARNDEESAATAFGLGSQTQRTPATKWGTGTQLISRDPFEAEEMSAVQLACPRHVRARARRQRSEHSERSVSAMKCLESADDCFHVPHSSFHACVLRNLRAAAQLAKLSPQCSSCL